MQRFGSVGDQSSQDDPPEGAGHAASSLDRFGSDGDQSVQDDPPQARPGHASSSPDRTSRIVDKSSADSAHSLPGPGLETPADDRRQKGREDSDVRGADGDPETSTRSIHGGTSTPLHGQAHAEREEEDRRPVDQERNGAAGDPKNDGESQI